jgi:hypothetical protein
MPAFLTSPDCGSCRCVTSPYGLLICVRGCGCPGCPPSPGARLLGGTVTIKSGETTVASCTVTSSDGCCRFLGLDPGTYTVEVAADRYVTQTATIVYTTPLSADWYYAYTLCPAEGYHCLGCSRPALTDLVLTFTRPLDFVYDGFGGVASITLDGPITLTRRDATNADYSSVWLGPTGTYWIGEGTAAGRVGAYAWGGRACDASAPIVYGPCERTVGDCGGVTFTDTTLRFGFRLMPCWGQRDYYDKPSGVYCPTNSWGLHVIGPPLQRCYSQDAYGPCTVITDYFSHDRPYTWAPGQACTPLVNSVGVMYNLGGCTGGPIPGLTYPANTRACSPLNLGFTQDFRGTPLEIAFVTES